MPRLTQTLHDVLASRWFYFGVLTFFIIEASWIAISARYPMAFDENYHFGLIKLYSHQFGPFIGHEPVGASVFGDVTRYPSYLFHYLFSFIYRLVAIITTTLANQIVILRLLNVGLFTGGLIIWQKVYRQLGVGSALGNFSLLTLILLPQIPFLAGQINYDNLAFLLVAVSMLLAVKAAKSLGTSSWDVAALGWLLSLSLVASLVKYTFVPILAAYAIYFGVAFYRERAKLPRQLAVGWNKLAVGLKIGLVIALVVSGSLFMERYGYNAVRYHAIVPDCGRVIGTDLCLDYGPWARNYHYQAARGEFFNSNPLTFTSVWAWRMWQQPFFVIHQSYAAGDAFLLPELVTAIATIVGVGALCWQWRRLKKRWPLLPLALTVTLTYTGALWLLNYTEYSHYQRYVAIQARYLFLVFPLIFILLGQAISQLIASKNLKAALAAVGMLLILQGGGIFGYLATTNKDWWWPNQTVITLNQTAQKVISPLLVKALVIKGK